ncbi:unnamed protein product [Oikopleura dioica]|uniref:Uncharacterized protein n=1 Tax=Oikopleura dioica TaxID=34765 RepID=E4Y1Z2_OIKDI|nr:unnamed protein product [Oikopleura dioica]
MVRWALRAPGASTYLETLQNWKTPRAVASPLWGSITTLRLALLACIPELVCSWLLRTCSNGSHSACAGSLFEPERE